MKYALFTLLILLPLAAAAQDDSEEKNQRRMAEFLSTKENKTEKAPTASTPPKQKKTEPTFSADTAIAKIVARTFPDVRSYYSECYAKAVKKNGFWKGIGPQLTKEERRHVWRYVRLLRPAGRPAGTPFTLMQVFNPFDQLDNNAYAPLLANPFGSDDHISSDWKSKLESICQFEVISRDGRAVQENMYDEDGKLVLSYFPVTVSENQIIGHYTDASGTLAKLRDDEECTYVGVTLDENGYESRVTFMDADGHLKRNHDDAFTQLFWHDRQGNLTKVMSADAVGKPITDNCGNCGWEYTYDDRGKSLTATCIDRFGRPQRMPLRDDNDDCIRERCTYDTWGNLLTKAFYDEDWQPDTITGGIHRYVFTKTLYGNNTSMRLEGLDGKLVPGYSNWSQKLDDQGHVLHYEKHDADGLLWTNGKCLTNARYSDGKRMWEERFTSTNGRDSVPLYRYVRTAHCDSIYYFDEGYVNIERYDDQRNLISDEYYDLDMQPLRYGSYHKHTITKTRQENTDVSEERYYDEHGQLMPIGGDNRRDYNVDIYYRDRARKTYTNHEYDGTRPVSTTFVDSVARLKTITKYTADGHIANKFAVCLSEDCQTNEGLIYFDSLGCRGRTFKADALYYHARKTVNIQGNTVAWQGFNEFGEPSYIANGDWESAPIYHTNVIGDPYYYDEYGDSIPSGTDELKAFKSRLTKAFCIELIDSAAIGYGLRTGDVIVRYGDWHYPSPSRWGNYQQSLLCLESVRKATCEKTMVVMRHNPATRTSRLIELHMPKGTPRQLGFLYHMIFLTDKEEERYVQTVAAQPNVALDSENTDIEGKDPVNFYMPYKIGDDDDKLLFMNGFQDNVVVLAWEPHVDGQSYLLVPGDALFDRLMGCQFDSITLHYTVDARHVLQRVLSFDEARTGGRYSSTDIDDASDIRALSDSLAQTFSDLHQPPLPPMKPHDAAQRLLQLSGTTETTEDGSQYRGTGPGLYGQVNRLYYVTIDDDELSLPEKITATEILANIDYSDYCYMHSDDDYAYFLEQGGRFTECVWANKKSIVFISDSVDFYDKSLIVAEVADSGHFSQRGIEGKFVILRCNDWFLGGTMPKLSEAINVKGERQFVLARLEGDEDAYTLGESMRVTVPEGKIGISWGWQSVSDEIFADAYQMMKWLKKKKK